MVIEHELFSLANNDRDVIFKLISDHFNAQFSWKKVELIYGYQIFFYIFFSKETLFFHEIRMK